MKSRTIEPKGRQPRLAHIRVRGRPGGQALGRVTAGALSFPCVLGPGGLTRRKREGDGATPVGRFAVLGGFFRADRIGRPAVQIGLRPSRGADGWCDDSRSARYNKPVRLPFGGSAERMWRQDDLYDLGLVIDYNHSRPRKNRGSAIFVHVMSPGGKPTLGCVAMRLPDLRRLLPRLARRCTVVIG